MATRLATLLAATAAHAALAKYLYARAAAAQSGAVDVGAALDAARLMYYGGDLAELLLATALFTAWYRRASRTAQPSRRSPSVARRIRPISVREQGVCGCDTG
jgi:putative membrane protein